MAKTVELIYQKRFEKHADELRWLYMELYNNDSMYAELCDNMYRFYEERKEKWIPLNEFIHNELKDKVDFLFDCVPVLGKKDEPHMSIYGGHPNDEGGRVWAEALYSEIKKYI